MNDNLPPSVNDLTIPIKKLLEILEGANKKPDIAFADLSKYISEHKLGSGAKLDVLEEMIKNAKNLRWIRNIVTPIVLVLLIVFFIISLIYWKEAGIIDKIRTAQLTLKFKQPSKGTGGIPIIIATDAEGYKKEEYKFIYELMPTVGKHIGLAPDRPITIGLAKPDEGVLKKLDIFASSDIAEKIGFITIKSVKGFIDKISDGQEIFLDKETPHSGIEELRMKIIGHYISRGEGLFPSNTLVWKVQYGIEHEIGGRKETSWNDEILPCNEMTNNLSPCFHVFSDKIGKGFYAISLRMGGAGNLPGKAVDRAFKVKSEAVKFYLDNPYLINQTPPLNCK